MSYWSSWKTSAGYFRRERLKVRKRQKYCARSKPYEQRVWRHRHSPISGQIRFLVFCWGWKLTNTVSHTYGSSSCPRYRRSGSRDTFSSFTTTLKSVTAKGGDQNSKPFYRLSSDDISRRRIWSPLTLTAKNAPQKAFWINPVSFAEKVRDPI